jgi:hypothetical protein
MMFRDIAGSISLFLERGMNGLARKPGNKKAG